MEKIDCGLCRYLSICKQDGSYAMECIRCDFKYYDMKSTVYTAPEGAKIKDVVIDGDKVIINYEKIEKEKTWFGYAEHLGYKRDEIRFYHREILFEIALSIMDDITKNTSISELRDGKYYVPSRASKTWFSYGQCVGTVGIFRFIHKHQCDAFIDVCGDEFLDKLYGV